MTSPIQPATVVLLVTLAVCGGARAADGPAPRPAPEARAEVSMEARKVLESVVADRKALRLSMGKDGAADRFQFVLVLEVPARGGGVNSSRYVIARDGGDVAGLLLSARGEPFAYATNNLWIGFDPTDPGRLVAYEKGMPRLIFGLGENGHKLEMELSFVKGIETPELRVDVASLLEGAMGLAEVATYDGGNGLLRVTTKNMVMSVALPLRKVDGGFPISGLVIQSKAGATVTLSEVQVGGGRPMILGVDKPAFERTGLPTRLLSEMEDPKVPLFVPPGFGDNEKERRAADRLRDLFPSACRPRNGPATRETRDDGRSSAGRRRDFRGA